MKPVPRRTEPPMSSAVRAPMRSAALLIAMICLVRPARADDPAVMAKLVAPDAHVEKVRGGFGFLEGTVWTPAGLVFSDEGPGRSDLLRWTAAGGVTVVRHPSNTSNGNTLDRQGRLVTCEQDVRAVTRTEADGRVTTLVDRYRGKRFNSPNDVVVKSDGTVWFTDPPYGLPAGQKRELDGNWAFRFDPATGDVTPVVTDMHMPNGIAFSPDERLLYVSDTAGDRHHIRAYDVAADGRSVANGRVLCATDVGVPDGFRVDEAGRIWTSAGDGVQVFAADGTRVGKIAVPESPANLCFGGADGRTLFIAARTGLYRIPVKVRGAGRP